MPNPNSTASTLDKVASEAVKEILAELDQGKHDALLALEGTMRQTKDSLTKIDEQRKKQTESTKRKTLGSAELAARNKVLRVVEEAVDQVFSEALSKVKDAEPRDYLKSMERLIGEGASVVGSDAVVSCNKGDRTIVSSIINGMNKKGTHLTLDASALESVGGVMLTSPKGNVRFDNTIEARLERLKPTLRREVVSILTS